MKSLYELSNEYAALLEAGEAIDEETGEVLPVDGLLALLKGDMESKVTGILAVSCEWGHRITALREEEKRLADRRRALEAQKDRLRDYLADALSRGGIKKIEAGPWKVSLLPGRESVVCEDASKVPEEFQRIKTEPDIAGAKTMLKETGMLPPGFAVKPGKPSLRVQ